MNPAIDRFTALAPRILGRPITDREAGAFDKYLQLLLKWQRVQRLIGSTDPDWIVESLFLDSLLFLSLLPASVSSVADLGSGAGLPGLPIKVVRPDLRMTLIESRERRASFLSAAVRELELRDAEVVNARAEDFARTRQERFDAITMRCAGRADEMVPVARELLMPDGVLIVSGPPTRGPLSEGRWVEVPGLEPGRSRLFAVFPRSATASC